MGPAPSAHSVCTSARNSLWTFNRAACGAGEIEIAAQQSRIVARRRKTPQPPQFAARHGRAILRREQLDELALERKAQLRIGGAGQRALHRGPRMRAIVAGRKRRRQVQRRGDVLRRQDAIERRQRGLGLIVLALQEREARIVIRPGAALKKRQRVVHAVLVFVERRKARGGRPGCPAP